MPMPRELVIHLGIDWAIARPSVILGSMARVFSSPWCRCLDTAVLLNKGPVTSERSLGSFFNEMSESGKQTRELEAFVRQQLSKPNKLPLILVTHQVNTYAYTGMSIGVGQMLLVKVNAQGKAISSRALN
jgi:hypothetical protein